MGQGTSSVVGFELLVYTDRVRGQLKREREDNLWERK